jgi:acetyltransferase-like isoleucine patch superfamily enzyme
MIKLVVSKVLKKARLSSVRESEIHRTAKVESGSSVYRSSLGRYSFCGYDCELFYASVGSFTSIANNVVLGGARHPMEWISTSPVFYHGRDSVRAKFSEHRLPDPLRVEVGHDVWVGRSAIVISGVRVGTGAVIGAGAVVSRDVPPYSVVVGNPARVVKMRFSDDIVKQLLETKWWEFEESELSLLANRVRAPADFLEACKRNIGP